MNDLPGTAGVVVGPSESWVSPAGRQRSVRGPGRLDEPLGEVEGPAAVCCAVEDGGWLRLWGTLGNPEFNFKIVR